MDLSIFWLVVQERVKIHKKSMPLKSILNHFRSTFLFLFRGVGGSDHTLKQAALYAHICYHNPTPLLPPKPITANQHHPLLPTSVTHCYHPPPASTTATTHHGGWQRWVAAVGCISGWWRLWLAAVDGSSGWQWWVAR